MATFNQIRQWLSKDNFRLDCLFLAKEHMKHEWYLSAGFVRNLVWDKLQGHAHATPLNDVDLIFFDPSCVADNQDKLLEHALKRQMPTCNWSVKNQARMALKHDHAPYSGCIEAMSYWPEIQTAIGVTLTSKSTLQVHSPFSENEVMRLAASRNPKCTSDAFYRRVENKCWLESWPDLVIEP